MESSAAWVCQHGSKVLLSQLLATGYVTRWPDGECRTCGASDRGEYMAEVVSAAYGPPWPRGLRGVIQRVRYWLFPGPGVC
jgi:hypothetical protein